MKDNLDSQKETIKTMIKLYCNKNHNTKYDLCEDCSELLNYALKRIENCKFGENKPNCGSCKIHCYKKDMKEKIIKVMRFSGPRMIIYHPIMVFKHLINK